MCVWDTHVNYGRVKVSGFGSFAHTTLQSCQPSRFDPFISSPRWVQLLATLLALSLCIYDVGCGTLRIFCTCRRFTGSSQSGRRTAAAVFYYTRNLYRHNNIILNKLPTHSSLFHLSFSLSHSLTPTALLWKNRKNPSIFIYFYYL